MLSYLKSIAEQARRELDGRSVAICVFAALALIAVRYAGKGNPEGPFAGLGWWMLVNLSCYLALPVLFVKAFLREDLADHGLTVKGASKDWRLSLSLLAAMVPLILVAAGKPGFVKTYPLYLHGVDEARSMQYAWELVYLAHFLAVEFFFRGFLLHGLKRRFGWNAVLISLFPYVMIHFGKPAAETGGSIAAGLVLGVLSLRTGSVLPGFAVHAGAALLMDMLALRRSGFL